MLRTAVALVTHNDNPRIIRHFERLQSEAGIPAFRVRHVAEDHWAPRTEQDIPLRNEDLAASMPNRYAEMKTSKRGIGLGYCDLVVMTAASSPVLSAFDALWFLEYDVDYSGHWKTFFTRSEKTSADLIAFRFQRPEDNPEWTHWKTFAWPDGAQPMACFIPAMRVTRALVKEYKREMDTGAWGGNVEATIPSVALNLGLPIINMGAGAEFSQPDDLKPVMDHATFGFRPARSSSYFHETPGNFPKPGMLYHPVKV